MLRQFLIVLSLLLAVVGCSSGSDSGDIAFEHVFYMPEGTSVWSATGEAIDNELLCSAATGILEGFEDEEGAVRRPEEIGALYEAGEPFVNVSVEKLTCDDGSGEFTLRFINDLDPTISDGPPVVATTWTITGGAGYDSTEGDGEGELPEEQEQTSVQNATGTITKG